MQFRLTYEGTLLGASRNDSRAKHKHDIRKIFHPQLKCVWETFPGLDATMKEDLPDLPYYDNSRSGDFNRIEILAEKFSCGKYRLVPLVTQDLSLICGLHILFLRPDSPGKVVRSGDIDNRLKTVFDALRMPQNEDELGGHSPTEDENPFYCLLEDDKLIDKVSLETDVLLKPTSQDGNRNDSRLIITVTIRPSVILQTNLKFI